jgi:uncharacterized protein (TIGR02145 family)
MNLFKLNRSISLVLFLGMYFQCLSQENEFEEVQIGNQIWMTKNLNSEVFKNGDIILEAKSLEEWNLAFENKQPAWCYYKNKKGSGEEYGKLYNYFAVIDTRGLAPEGWHIPSIDEWNVFIDSISENGLILSIFEGNDQNEDIGFNAFFAGCRDNALNFIDKDQWTYWWTAVDGGAISCNVLSVQPSYYPMFVDVKSGISAISWEDGFSVRCVKNSE